MVIMATNDPLKSANVLLSRALDLETKSQYTQALVLYQEALQLYLDYVKVAPDSKKKAIRERISHFMEKAEKVKQQVQDKMKLSTYHEEVVIAEDEEGHSYQSVFGHLLNSDIQIVRIEDPYIRNHQQYKNVVSVCELLVKKCPKLSKIVVVTIFTGLEQETFFTKIGRSLLQRGIQFVPQSNPTLHDRQISLSNGWVIKLGRGLDYLKRPPDHFSLGSFDFDLLPCRQTKIDIYFNKDIILD